MASQATLDGTISAGPSSARAERRVHDNGGLSWSDHVTLAAIGLVVVLVALPGLRRFALRENETDAVRMLRLISIEAGAPGELHTAREPGGLLAANTPAQPFATRDLRLVLAPGSALQRRLGDIEILADGRVRRHGYLFDWTETPSGNGVLRAWPWEHGHTGIGAFLLFPEFGVLGDANPDGRYSGPDKPPPAGARSDPRWVSLPRF